MRDVEYLLHKSKYNLKGLTLKAREVMLRELNMPSEFADGEVFFHGVTPDKFPGTIQRLQELGLETEHEHVDTKQFTDW